MEFDIKKLWKEHKMYIIMGVIIVGSLIEGMI